MNFECDHFCLRSSIKMASFANILQELVKDDSTPLTKTNAEKKIDRKLKERKRKRISRVAKIINQNKNIQRELDLDEDLPKEKKLRKIASKGVAALFQAIYNQQKAAMLAVKESKDAKEADDLESESEDNLEAAASEEDEPLQENKTIDRDEFMKLLKES